MTPKEFKIQYPQYAHLEGDELWDKMEEVFISSNEVYTADPNREIIYHDPVKLPNGIEVSIEDSSKTVWINSKGEKGFIKEKEYKGKATESYRMDIIDFSKNSFHKDWINKNKEELQKQFETKDDTDVVYGEIEVPVGSLILSPLDSKKHSKKLFNEWIKNTFK